MCVTALTRVLQMSSLGFHFGFEAVRLGHYWNRSKRLGILIADNTLASFDLSGDTLRLRLAEH